MISSSQLSLFSLNSQKKLLDKYGILISNKTNNKLRQTIYQLQRSFFVVYINETDKKILSIYPINNILV